MYDDLKKRIIRIMEMKTPSLNSKEEQYVAMWKDEYKLKDDIVIEGFKRALSIKGQNTTFAYVSAILKNWSDRGVKSYSDILALDEEFRKRKKEKADKEKKVEDGDKKSLDYLESLRKSVKIKLLSDTAKVIVKGSIIRLFADVKEEHSLELGENYIIPLNVSVSIPYGYIGLIELDPNLGLYLASDKIIVGKDKKLELNVRKLIGAASVLRSGDKIARLVLVNGFTGDAEVVKYKKQS